MDRPTGPARWSPGSPITVSGWCDSRMPACQQRATEVWSYLWVAPPPCPPPLRGRGKWATAPALPLPRSGGGREGVPRVFSSTPTTGSLPTRCHASLTALEASPHAVAAVGAYTFAGTRRIRPPPSGDLLPRLLIRNLFANGGHVLVRREVLAAGGFLTDIAYGEDWEFWTRIALQGPFAAAADGRRSCSCASTRAAPITAWPPNPPRSPHAWRRSSPTRPARPLRPQRLAAIRRRTEAENAWIIGRELIRHGHASAGRAWLVRLGSRRAERETGHAVSGLHASLPLCSHPISALHARTSPAACPPAPAAGR